MPSRFSSAVRCLLAAAAVAVAAGAAASLYFAADWLRASTQPSAADFIVVLAGAPQRSLYAAELYKAGYAKAVLVSRPARESSLVMLDQLGIAFPLMEDVYRQVLERSGVPSGHIRVFGQGAISTFEEARTLSRLIGDSRPRLLVVTSPYHVRRAALILNDVAGVTAREITVVGTPHEAFPARWWTSQDAARHVLLELAKIAFYRLGGRFEAAEPRP